MTNIFFAVFTLAAVQSYAAITGTVMSRDGKAIGGAKVSLFAIETTDARRARLTSKTPERVALASVQTGANGKFSLESPKDQATLDLRVEARGFAPESARIERDEEVSAIALSVAETKKGRITAAGKPVPGASVIWMSGGAESAAVTDAEGTFSVPDPTKWATRMIVNHPDFALIDENVGGFGAAKKSLDRSLDVGVPLTGTVLAADGQTPVAKATIRIDNWPAGTTAENGTFTIAHAPRKWDLVDAHTATLAGSRGRGKDALTIQLGSGGSLSGTIRDAKTQSGIAGVEVRLSRNTGSPFGGDGTATASTITDAKGNYQLSGVPAGSYRLTATHPGYNAPNSVVSITAGAKAQRSVSATQLARVTGSVVTEDKQPMAAAVLAAQETSGDGMRMFMAAAAGRSMRSEGVSAPDGRFVIRVQPDADVEVTATRKGYPQGKSGALRLAAGERKSGVTLVIPRGMQVTGKVVDRDGRPLSGVSVVAIEAERGGGGMIMRQVVISNQRERADNVETASDGTFALRLKEGAYDLSFKREGFATKASRGVQVSGSTPPLEITLDGGVQVTGRITRGGAPMEGVLISGITPDGDSINTVSAPDGSFAVGDLSPGVVMLNFSKPDEFIQQMRNVTAPARDYLVELPAGSRVSGRVVDKGSKRPIQDFQAGVTASRGGGGMMIVSQPQLRSFSSEDGSFVLENVQPGPIQVVATAAGYTMGRSGTLTIEEGKPLTDVELALDTGVRVTGRVTGPDGSPLGGVQVRVAAVNPAMRMRGMISDGSTGTTESNGEYVLDAVEAGEKTLSFSAPNLLTEQKTVTLSGREARVDARLSAGTRVRGIVVTEGGAPVAEASIRAQGAATGGFGGAMAKSDASGAFTFEALEPGRYTFIASKSGYADGTVRDLDITSSGALRLTLSSGGVIYGHVGGLSETEQASATVMAVSPTGRASAHVDASGNFRIEGAPTGTVRVAADISKGFGESRSTPAKSVQLDAGGSVQVDLEFDSQTSVRGRVTRNGKPLEGAVVIFNPRAGRTDARTTTDGSGNYSINGLADGAYSVSVVDLQRFTPWSGSYDVRGSGTFDVDIRTSSIRGRVVDADTGEGVSEAAVQLQQSGISGGPMFGGRAIVADTNGVFSADITPGSYNMIGEKTGYVNDVQELTVTESGRDDLVLKLVKADGVVIRVVDARDKRLLNSYVRVFDARDRVVYETAMRFGGGPGQEVNATVAPGQYRAMIYATGYAPRMVPLTSPSHPTIELTPGGTLVLRSRSGEMQTARLVDSSGRTYPRNPMMTTFDLDPSPGATTVNNIAPGTYRVQVLDGAEQVVKSVEVTVVEGQTATFDV